MLSNPEKRKQYDQFGEEKVNPSRHGHSDFHRGFEADISPEDLFNMFFGGGFPTSKHFYCRSLIYQLSVVGLLNCMWCWIFLEQHGLLIREPFPGNVHVYSNGRMRYTHAQRQDRREHQGDVSSLSLLCSRPIRTSSFIILAGLLLDVMPLTRCV